jgi:hypothetical protein
VRARALPSCHVCVYTCMCGQGQRETERESGGEEVRVRARAAGRPWSDVGCMYVCMYVRVYVCVYVFLHVCVGLLVFVLCVRARVFWGGGGRMLSAAQPSWTFTNGR